VEDTAANSFHRVSDLCDVGAVIQQQKGSFSRHVGFRRRVGRQGAVLTGSSGDQEQSQARNEQSARPNADL
jgi:hypothetical protein